MGDEDTERNPVTLVVDPSLSAEERSRLVRKMLQSHGSEDNPAGCLIALSIGGAVILTILHNVAGVSWWWMTVIAVPLLASIASSKAHMR